MKIMLLVVITILVQKTKLIVIKSDSIIMNRFINKNLLIFMEGLKPCRLTPCVLGAFFSGTCHSVFRHRFPEGVAEAHFLPLLTWWKFARASSTSCNVKGKPAHLNRLQSTFDEFGVVLTAAMPTTWNMFPFPMAKSCNPEQW